VLRFAQKRLGTLVRNQYRRASNLPLAANVDALIKESGVPVEAKTSGLFGPLPAGWGEPETDEVPDNVIIQSHVHMMCTDKDICHVAAFLGGVGFQMYIVPLSREIADEIGWAAINFWDRHVLADTPPEDSTPSLELLKKVKREPDVIVDVPDVLVDTWQELRQIRLEAEKKEKQAQAELLAALDTAEAGQFSGGIITYREQVRKAYSVPESKYRVLRIKKEK